MMIQAFLFAVNISSQSLIYPDITKDKINKVVFLDEMTGFFVNEGGTIYKTVDGGETWQKKIHLAGSALSDIKFLTKEKGFAFSTYSRNPYGGLLVSTEDTGETWKITYIEFFDGVAFQPLDDNSMLKSTNKGEIKLLDNFYGSWKTAYKMNSFNYFIIDIFDKVLDKTDGNTPYGTIKSFHKFSDSLTYAFGTSENAFAHRIIKDSVNFVLKSHNKGASWDTLWVGFNFIAKKIVFVNELSWWLLGQNEIYKTNNAGENWQKIRLDLYNCADIFVLDSLKVFILEEAGRNIFYSLDGGIGWKSTTTNLPFDQAKKIIFLNQAKGFAYGKDIFATKNNGNDWQYVSKCIRDDIIDIDFVNKQKGWTLGVKGLYFTTDGGRNWTKKILPIDEFQQYSRRSSLEMIDNLYGWVNSDSKVYKTTDGGDTWNEVKINSSLVYGKIKFYNKIKGIIYNVLDYSSTVPQYRFILSTSDGGNSWNKFPDTLNQDYDFFRDAAFSDSSKLWAVNFRGLWLSTDLGKNWKLKYSRNSYSEKSISFLDSKNGFVSLDSEKIIRTKDGGDTWESYNSYNHLLPFDLVAIGPNNHPNGPVIIAFSPGYKGEIIKSYFGTNSYYYQEDLIPTFTSESIRSFSVYIENNRPNIWMAGDGFTILYREYETIISDVQEELNEQVPNNYSLSQNYPNPFNPTTTIKFSIPNSQFVILEVYDILGSEVATLVNEEKSPGNYDVKFDGSNLSSGVYFYRLSAGVFSKTKKFVLMK